MLGCKGTRAAQAAPLTARQMAEARTGTGSVAMPTVYFRRTPPGSVVA